MTRKKNAEPATPKRTSPTLEFLPVAYTNTQLLDMAQRMARTSSERDQTLEHFEVIKTNHRHQIEAMENHIRDLTRKIGRGYHYENVDCLWLLEDPTPHEKTLVRQDTGEIVHVVPMEKSDFQEVLLPAALQPERTATSATMAAESDFQLSPAAAKKEKTPPAETKAN